MKYPYTHAFANRPQRLLILLLLACTIISTTKVYAASNYNTAPQSDGRMMGAIATLAAPTNTPLLPVVDLLINTKVAGYQAPTNLDPAPEPIYPAAIDDIPYVVIGSTVIVTIEVTNTGDTLAEAVMLAIVTDGVTVTLEVGNMPADATVIEWYLATATEGLTATTITASTSVYEPNFANNVQSVMWNGVWCEAEVVADEDLIVYGQECSSSVTINRLFLPIVKR